MKSDKLKKLLVNKDYSVKETMRVIDQGALSVAFVIEDGNKLFGLVTDGDIRGAILKGADIEDKIDKITNKNPIIKREGEEDLSRLNGEKVLVQDVHMAMPAGGSIRVPIIDDKRNIKDIVFIYGGGQHGFRFKPEPKSNDRNIRKALIIGGAGYLGSVLCRKLLDRGYKVKVLDNLTYDDEGIKDLYQDDNFEFLKGDIRNISDVVEAVKGVDAVIHLAAIVGDPASSLDTEETLEINYFATKSIIDICKYFQVNKFLFASTCSLYGASLNTKIPNPKERLGEDYFLNPVSLYAQTKFISEKAIENLTDMNFSPTIFRFATLYGVSPRMRFDLVVNLLTAKALKDKKITIFGGEQWRPNLDVSDAALTCLKWVESPIKKTGGKIFNVGSNEQNYQIIKLGEIIKKSLPETEIEIKKEEGDIRNYNVSFNEISKVLGFKPEKTVEQAVIEIKKLIKSQKIKDFNSPKYNNHRFLSY